MFLQKYRYQLPQRNSFALNISLSNSRKQDASKRISKGQLKRHEQRINYSEDRKFLIENTQKAIGQKPRIVGQFQYSSKNYETKDSIDLKKHKSFIRQRYDLSKREERVLAAKRYREKIWKNSDIAGLVRAQQELMQSRRTEHLRRPSFQCSQKVQRYKDLLQQFGEEATLADKQKLKKQWLAQAFKSGNNQQKNQTNFKSHNPELQVTNFEFMQSQELPRNFIKILNSRQRRKQMIRRTSKISYFSHSKRPNTTGSNPHKFQENLIQPW